MTSEIEKYKNIITNQYHIEAIHPHLLHLFSVEVEKRIVDYCYQAQKDDPVGVNNSNYGGWQSKDTGDGIVRDFINNILSRTSEVFTRVPVCTNYWVNINKPKDFNTIHNHPNSDISGVVWIKTPDECGEIYFPHPDYFQKYKEIEHSKAFTKQGFSHVVRPNKGDVVLFPSYLRHGVTENCSKEERISIAFNAIF